VYAHFAELLFLDKNKTMKFSNQRLVKFLLIITTSITLSSCSALKNLSKPMQCKESAAFAAGESDGSAGKSDYPGLSSGQACAGYDYNPTMFQSAYMNGFRAGLETFCQEKNVQSKSFGVGSRLNDLVVSEESFKICEGQSASRLFSIARKAHAEGVEKACNPIEISVIARSDARDSVSASQGLSKLNKCPESRQSEFLQLYENSYAQEEAKIAREAAAEAEKNRLELERQRLQMERERALNDRSPDVIVIDGGGPQGTKSGKRFIDPKSKREFYTECEIDGSSAEVSVWLMPSPRHGLQSETLNGKWSVQIFDRNRRLKRMIESRPYLFMRPNNDQEFTLSLSSSDRAHSCIASYLGE
jgi:hypothetical protein